MLRVIDSLELINSRVLCKDKNGKLDEAIHIQGTLDGACSIYSLLMDLLILRVINHSDIRIYNTSKDYGIKKFLKILREKNGMHIEGRYYQWIQKQINTYIPDRVSCFRKKNFDIEIVSQYINNNIPVMLSILNKKIAHSILCIGYESNEQNDITKLLCLDPSSVRSEICYWNSYIDLLPNVKTKIYRFYYSTMNEYVSLDAMLIIEKK